MIGPDLSPVDRRFTAWVKTTHAQLLCDLCAYGRRHTPHTFSHVIVAHDLDQRVRHADVMFTCDVCGTVRQWGQMGAHPVEDAADEPEPEPDPV